MASALSAPAGSEYDEEEVDYEESDSDESWTTESAISSEAILGSMCMNGGEEKPFACPVPGCKKRYKVKMKRKSATSRATTAWLWARPTAGSSSSRANWARGWARAASGQGRPWFPLLAHVELRGGGDCSLG